MAGRISQKREPTERGVFWNEFFLFAIIIIISEIFSTKPNQFNNKTQRNSKLHQEGNKTSETRLLHIINNNNNNNNELLSLYRWHM